MRIPMLRIRRSQNILIFNMGIHILVRHFYIETAPRARIQYKGVFSQYMKSECGDETVVRSSYPNNGISYTGKKTSLYWRWTQGRMPHCAQLIFRHRVYCLQCSNWATVREWLSNSERVVVVIEPNQNDISASEIIECHKEQAQHVSH